MSKLSILITGLVLTGGLIAAILLIDRQEADGDIASAPSTPHETVEAPEALEPMTAPKEISTPEAPSESPREEVEQESEVEDELEEPDPLPKWEPAESRWLDVSVLLPVEAPPDATLVVLALDSPRDFDELYGDRGIVPERQRLGRDSSYLGLVAVAPIDAMGQARIAFPPDVENPHIAVSGRFLYSMESLAVDLDLGRMELPVEVGAWVTGKLLPPIGVVGEWDDVELQLFTDISARVSLGTTSGQNLRIEREVPVGGQLEFLAVPLTTNFTLLGKSEQIALFYEEGLNPEPGEHFVVDIQLFAGTRVTGHIVDEEGDPVAGAEIEARTREFWGNAAFGVRETESEDDGSYSLNAVPSGKIWINVEHDDFTDYKTPSALEVHDGPEFAYGDITLSSGATIAGAVTFPDGSPAVGVELELEPDLSGNTAGFPVNQLDYSGVDDSILADERGEFSFKGLGKGPFRLVAKIEEPEETHRTPGMWRGNSSGLDPVNDVEACTQLLLVLDAPLSLSGVVLDLEGSPLTDFKIRASLAASVWYLPPMATESEEFESEDGSFTIGDMRAGEWTVNATAEGFAAAEGVKIKLPSDELVEIRLSRPASITGIVVDPDGNPVSGALIEPELNLQQMLERQRGQSSAMLSATSDSSGQFTLEGIAPGTGTVMAAKDGWARSEEFAYELEQGQEIGDVTLELRLGGTITGEVIEEDGSPMVGVSIFIQQPAGMRRRTTRTDEKGRFREEHLEPASWQVMALPMTSENGEFDQAAMMSSMKITMVELIDGAEEHVILGAQPENPVVVRGRITAAGEPVSKVLISFIPASGGGFEKMKLHSTDESGEYEVTLTEPGDYLVTLQQQLEMGRQDSLEYRRIIPDTEETELDFQLPGGRITGTVFGPDGEPLSSARITLNIDGGAEFGTIFGGKYTESAADDIGDFELPYLRPGAYLVAAGGPVMGGLFGEEGGQSGRMVTRVEVSEGQWVRGIDFHLDYPGSVKGIVVDHAGSPVKDATLFARDETGKLLEIFSFVTTDAGGRFEYKGLAPGRYSLAARTTNLSSAENELIRVESGQETEARIVMDPGTMLEVSLQDKSGKLVPAIVSVTDAQGREVNGMRALKDIMDTYAKGVGSMELRIGPLPPGTYSVRAVTTDGRNTKRSVTLSGQEVRKLRLRLK